MQYLKIWKKVKNLDDGKRLLPARNQSWLIIPQLRSQGIPLVGGGSCLA
jgi:hypothetical protein